MALEKFGLGRSEKPKGRLEDLKFQSAESAIGLFEDHFKEDLKPAEVDAVRSILYSFFRQEVANANQFSSPEHPGVSFVHSRINTAEIAKALYKAKTGEEPVIKFVDPHATRKIECVFPSFFASTNTSALHVFFEQALHHVIKELPAALENLQEGKKPEEHDIYLVQPPVSDMGRVSPEFVAQMQDGHAYEELGKLYSGFISSKLKEHPETDSVFLRGISMGACQAIETAKALVTEHMVKQLGEAATEKNLPLLQVRIDTPPGQSEMTPEERRWQIPRGFIAHGVSALVKSFTSDGFGGYDVVTSSPWGNFTKQVLPILEKEKGITRDMSPEQSKLKKEGIEAALENLYAGVPIPKDLKVTEVLGESDLTMFWPLSSEKTDLKKRLRAGEAIPEKQVSLGKKLISDKETPNRRTFSAEMGHQLPNFYENEMRRLRKAAQTLVALRA